MDGSSPNIDIASLQLFRGEAHRSFELRGGRRAAVLVHGFLGSPAELRPLAVELNQAGWSVYAPLLPGFGAEIPSLFERRWTDWIDAVGETVGELTAAGRPVLLIGYSMGAAVSLRVAADMYVDGLALLAPFWRIGSPVQRLIWQGVKRVFPQFQPFRRADFSDSRLQAFFEKTMPMLDMDDLAVQEAVRHLRVPSGFVDEVSAVGKAAVEAAAKIRLPTLIVQGTEDEAVKPALTRQLITLLGGQVSYQELKTDHDLVETDNPGFEGMVQFVLDYAIRMAESGGLPFYD